MAFGGGDRPIIIKRIKKNVAGGHHGGAWKVAYADFVTAMMAFFLLMWLINVTSPDQKRGIADYFAPASVSASTSGSGGILAGTTLGDQGVKGSGALATIEQLSPEIILGINASARFPSLSLRFGMLASHIERATISSKTYRHSAGVRAYRAALNSGHASSATTSSWPN